MKWRQNAGIVVLVLMEVGALTAQLKSMSIPMMRKDVNSAVPHHMVVAVLIAQQKNTDMGIVLINVFGVAQHQAGAVVRIVQQENMRNS